jgi:hypothetical protein
MRRSLLVIIALAIVVAAWQESTQAIPAFARRYRLSCKTCHNPFPRLSAYGEEFAGNGFQLPDGEEPARSFVDVGDEKLALLREVPIAVRVDLHARYTPDAEEVESDFQFPSGMKLLSGGAIFKNISYYFYFYMDERGEVAGVEDAFVYFNNLLGRELDISAGQFQVSDPLFKRELRLTYEDYQIYKTRVGDSTVNLTYDRGFIFSYSPLGGTDLVMELLNGNGKAPAGEDGGAFDDDSFKNILLRGSQDLMEGLRLGAFYYYGRHTADEITNRTNYWGIDGTFDFKEKLTVNWQYLERRDDDPFYSDQDLDDTKTTGGLVEAIYAPKAKDSNWYLIFLYNKVNSDLDVYDYETVAFNASYLILRNMRIFGEYTRDIEFEANGFTGGLVFAF